MPEEIAEGSNGPVALSPLMNIVLSDKKLIREGVLNDLVCT